MNGTMETRWQERPRHHGQRDRLLNRLSLAGVVGGAALLATMYLVGGGALAGLDPRERLRALVPFIGSWMVVLMAWLWRGLGYWPRSSALLFAGYMVAGVTCARQGLSGSGRLWLLILPALVFVLMDMRLAGFAALFSAMMYAVLAVMAGQGWSPPNALHSATLSQWIGEGGSLLILMTALLLVVRSLDRGWARARGEAEGAQRHLESGREKLVELTKELRRKSSQLQTAAAVARAGASTLGLDALLDQIVGDVLDGFDSMGVYYVGCFLLEDSGDAVVLRAGASRRDQPPLEKGHRLSLDRRSAVASAIVDQELQIATRADEGTDQARSEIALPLCSAGRTLGAISLLSVRDVQELASNEDDREQLEAIVDQVAVAIQNAQLFDRTQTVLTELEAVHQRYSTAEWTRFLARRSDFQVDYAAPGAEASHDGFLREARRLAIKENRPIARDTSPVGSEGASDRTEGALIVPLRLRGQPIGTMALHETRRKPAWTAEDVALAETVAEEIAQTVESLLLMDESRRRLARERLIGEVAARMRESLDVESVLKTGAVGIREAMGLPAVTVRLTGPDANERAESS